MSESENPKKQHKRLNRATYTVPKAGEKLGVGKNTAYEAARTGQIPTIRVGRRILVPKFLLDRLLEG